MTKTPIDDTTSDLFDYAAAKELRDAGIELVEENEPTWMYLALAATPPLIPMNEDFTIEQLRRALLENGFETPHHPNCWGAYGMNLVRRGWIERTGEWVHATAKKSHACMVPKYRRINRILTPRP